MLSKNRIITLLENINRNGIEGLFLLFKDVILRYWYFDRLKLKYSKKIIPVIQLNKEIQNSRYLEQANEYTMSRIEWLNASCNSIKENLSNLTILDIGSGEGLPLCFFAQKQFKKVIGVEYSSILCDTARQNMLKVEKKIKNVKWEIICGDAYYYKISDEVDVIWMFNPFKGELLKKVFNNIKIASKKKKILLIIANPQKEIHEFSFLKKIKEIRTKYPIINIYETA